MTPSSYKDRYVAGALHCNQERLKRHFRLVESSGHDPLNAAALAAGRHKTDPTNYRGLGYRTDAKERGRLVELFNFQAEHGNGIAKGAITAAIAQYHAKQAALEAQQARANDLIAMAIKQADAITVKQDLEE